MPLMCSFLALHSFPSHLKSFPWNPLVELHVDLAWSTLSLHISFVPHHHFFFFFFGYSAQHTGSWFPHQDSNPCPLQWKHSVLTTGSPDKSPSFLTEWFNLPLHCPVPQLHLSSLPLCWPFSQASTQHWSHHPEKVLVLFCSSLVLFPFFTRNPRACCLCQLLAFLSSFTPSLILSLYSASCCFTVTTLLTVKKTPFCKIQ